MTDQTIAISRALELPRAIVWDALVDPALVSGWLGEARIDARVGGCYELAWVALVDSAPLRGRIRDFDEPARLVIDSTSHGTIEWTLTEIEGGSRGTSTALDLAVTSAVETAFLRRAREQWEAGLEQLADLLRGRPVPWPERAEAAAIDDDPLPGLWTSRLDTDRA